ncbi:type II toxin-antitoxin system RatA family toxin [Chelativorans xinjiangense]|uniref:type II toxin-antitoxin system RatA family toxin n=1 Tax=Chelativorans xinjiangense TaxID=2681485 RepID=UPI003CCDCAE4
MDCCARGLSALGVESRLLFPVARLCCRARLQLRPRRLPLQLARMPGRAQSESSLEMTSYSFERVLPYDSEVLFDIAADVEQYPEFLPSWKAARITRREGNTYWTDQTIGLGPLRARFGLEDDSEPASADRSGFERTAFSVVLLILDLRPVPRWADADNLICAIRSPFQGP